MDFIHLRGGLLLQEHATDMCGTRGEERDRNCRGCSPTSSVDASANEKFRVGGHSCQRVKSCVRCKRSRGDEQHRRLRDSLWFVSSSNSNLNTSNMRRGPTKNEGLFELNDRTRTRNFPPNVTGPKRVLARRCLRRKERESETLSVFGT